MAPQVKNPSYTPGYMLLCLFLTTYASTCKSSEFIHLCISGGMADAMVFKTERIRLGADGSNNPKSYC